MNYLILNGSPHQGNTWKIVEHVKEKIAVLDMNAEIREIHLLSFGLPFCLGCSNCFRKSGEQCPHYDKMKEIYDAFDWADGIVISSSVFNMRETGLLKNLFDHMAYLLHRPKYFSKKAMVVTTTGGVGAKNAGKSISGTLYGIGFNKCFCYGASTMSWNAYVPSGKTLQKAGKVTQRFVQDVLGEKIHQPGYEVLIPYNLFRGMCQNCVPGTEYPTQDGIYWSEETRHQYVYEAGYKVTPLKWLFSQVFYLIGKMAGKKISVSYKK